MRSFTWVVFLCVFASSKLAYAQTDPSTHDRGTRESDQASHLIPQGLAKANQQRIIEEAIASITPTPASQAKPGMVYRIREERVRGKRLDAYEFLGRCGVAATPAIPTLIQLLDDALEPPVLKTKAIYVLEQTGLAGVSALPALKRASLSNDAGLKNAAQKAVAQIETLQRVTDAWRSGNEVRIEETIQDAIGLQDHIFPSLVAVYRENTTSDRTRASLIEVYQEIRFRSYRPSVRPLSELFNRAGSASNTFANREDAGIPAKFGEEALRESFGREIDQLMLMQMKDNASVDIIKHLARKLGEILEMPRQTETTDYFLGRSIELVNALSRQRQSMGASGDETLEILLRCYRHSINNAELHVPLMTCITNFLKTCPYRNATITRLRSNPENRRSPGLKSLLFPDVDDESVEDEEIINQPEFQFFENVRCEGDSVVFSSDFNYIAVFTRHSSGSFFGGGGKAGRPVQVYEVETGIHVAECGITSIQPTFNVTNRYLATGSSDRIQVWDLEQRKVHQEIPMVDVNWIEFLADENRILCLESRDSFSAFPSGIKMWNVDTNDWIASSRLKNLLFMDLSDDGRVLVGLSRSKEWKIELVDSKSLEEIASFDWTPAPGSGESHEQPVLLFTEFGPENDSLRIFHAKSIDGKILSSRCAKFDIRNRRLGPTTFRVSSTELVANDVLRLHRPARGVNRTLSGFWIAPSFQSISVEREGLWTVWDWKSEPIPSYREMNWERFSENALKMLKEMESDDLIIMETIAEEIVLVQSEHQRAVLDMKMMTIDRELTYAVQAGQLPVRLANRYIAWLVDDTLTVRDPSSGKRLYRGFVSGVNQIRAVNGTEQSFLVLVKADGQSLIWTLKENTPIEHAP